MTPPSAAQRIATASAEELREAAGWMERGARASSRYGDVSAQDTRIWGLAAAALELVIAFRETGAASDLLDDEEYIRGVETPCLKPDGLALLRVLAGLKCHAAPDTAYGSDWLRSLSRGDL